MGPYSGGIGGGSASATSNVSPGTGGGGMNFGVVGLVSSAFGAVQSFMQAKWANDIAGYNAEVIEASMRLIKVKQDIEFGQYQRAKGRMVGSSLAQMAANGVMPNGSSMAVMVSSFKEMTIDQAIGQFDYEMSKSYRQSEADATRIAGRDARTAGMSRGFSQLLQGGSKYAMYKGLTSKTDSEKTKINTGALAYLYG